MLAGSLTYDTKLDSKGFNQGLGKLKGIAKVGLAGVGTAVAGVTTAVAGIGIASIKARGEIEQSIGGVDTLFKDSAKKVIDNANKAYKTAGMSANDYMQNVTSFSASLLQSVAGDTEKAADVADMAMIDMSDNANKFGTNMQDIQNAYQGFAKQNYTMLDNLKLGYSGTKGEMERLLIDAEKFSGVHYDINNLKDVYEAIHVVQNELGITGTTAKEASETLEGSIGMVKASWENFLSGSGNLSTVVENVGIAFKNIMRIVQEAMPQIIDNLVQALPQFLDLAMQIINTIAQGLLDNLPTILQMGMQIIMQLIMGIIQQLPTLIPQIINIIILITNTLLDNIDLIIDAGIQLIFALVDGIINAIPVLIEKMPEIIQKVYDALIRNFPKIVRAGGELIGKLAVGLVQSLWKLGQSGPQIVHTIVNGIKGLLHEFNNTGRYLVEGLWNGIRNAKDWLLNKVRSWCGNIMNGIKSFFGIHSPSKRMQKEVGQWLPKGLAVGIDANTDSAIKAIDKMNNEIDREMRRAVNGELGNMNSSAVVRANNSLLSMTKLDVKVDGRVDIDGRKAGRLLAKPVTNTIRTAGAY